MSKENWNPMLNSSQARTAYEIMKLSSQNCSKTFFSFEISDHECIHVKYEEGCIVIFLGTKISFAPSMSNKSEYFSDLNLFKDAYLN